MKHALLGAVLALFVAASNADVNVVGALTGPEFHLIDLDPSDGHAPSTTFVSGSQHGEASTFSNGIRETIWLDTPAFYAGMTRTASNPPLFGEFLFSGAGGTFTTWTRAFSSVDSTTMSNYGETSAYAALDGVFLLSPKTQLRIVAFGQSHAESTLDTSVPGVNGMSTRSVLGAWSGTQAHEDSLNFTYTGQENVSRDESRLLSVTITNNSDHVVDVGIYTINASRQWISAVPEPSSFAIMLIGLAAIGCTLRRRSAKGPWLGCC